MAVQKNRNLLTALVVLLCLSGPLVYLLSSDDTRGQDDTLPALLKSSTSSPAKGASCDDSSLSQRSFLPANQRADTPVLLWSQPGSGNTMARLLIEYATGYLTGSPYADASLLPSLPGEQTCDNTVIAVKLHPLINPQRRRSESFYTAAFEREHGVCDGVDRFSRAIVLVRNPLDAIWADYQRFISEDHTHAVTAEGLDTRDFRKRATFTARQWVAAYAQHARFMYEHKREQDYLLVKFEDLQDKGTGIPLLRRLVHFLGAPLDQQRLMCAHDLAWRGNVKRERALTSVEALVQARALCPVLKVVRSGMADLGYASPPQAQQCWLKGEGERKQV